MLGFIRDGVLTIETILSKLSLFMRFLRTSREMAVALLPKLKEYQLVRAGRAISMDQLTSFLTLAKEIGSHEQDVTLCVVNVIFQVKESSQSNASLLKLFCREWGKTVINDSSTPDLFKALVSIIYEECWDKQVQSKREIDELCETML